MNIWFVEQVSGDYYSRETIWSIHDTKEEAEAEMARLSAIYGEVDDAWSVYPMELNKKVNPEVTERPWEEHVLFTNVVFDQYKLDRGDHWFLRSDRHDAYARWVKVGDNEPFKVKDDDFSNLLIHSMPVAVWNDPELRVEWEKSREGFLKRI